MSETNNQVTPPQSVEELTKVGEQIAEKSAVEADPLDTHAQMFYIYGPRLRNTLNLMSKKALARLVFSLIQHPLNDKEIKMREKIEQDAFQIADQMLTSKYMMILGTYLQTVVQNEEEKKNEKVSQVPSSETID